MDPTTLLLLTVAVSFSAPVLIAGLYLKNSKTERFIDKPDASGDPVTELPGNLTRFIDKPDASANPVTELLGNLTGKIWRTRFPRNLSHWRRKAAYKRQKTLLRAKLKDTNNPPIDYKTRKRLERERYALRDKITALESRILSKRHNESTAAKYKQALSRRDEVESILQSFESWRARILEAQVALKQLEDGREALEAETTTSLAKLSQESLERKLAKTRSEVETKNKLIEERIKEREKLAAVQLNYKFDNTATQSILARMEAKVIEKERKAQALLDPNSKENEPTLWSAAEKRIWSVLYRVNDLSSVYKEKISKAFEAIASTDSSLERAFERTRTALKTAHTISSHADALELEVEGKILECEQLKSEWKHREEGYECDSSPAQHAAARAANYENSIVEFSASLRKLKIKNLSNKQTLFRVDAITRRLRAVKLLLHALPGGKKTESAQFADIANAVTEFLKHLSDNQSPETVNFAERMAALENRVLMLYITLAKGPSEQLKGGRLNQFSKDTKLISDALELDRLDAMEEYEKWDAVAKQALEEDRKILQLVASERRDQSVAYIKLLTQSLEVVSTTLTLAKARQAKGKENDSESKAV
jgi:hypothetical protein